MAVIFPEILRSC